MTTELRTFANNIIAGVTKTKSAGGNTRYLVTDGFYVGLAEAYELAKAYLQEHPADAPDWYSTAEISAWLRSKAYHPEIAKELAELIATNYQLAFNKGFSMGERKGAAT